MPTPLGNYTCGYCGTLTPQNAVAALESTSEYYSGYGHQEVIWRCLTCASCGRYTLVFDSRFATRYFPPEGRAIVQVAGVPERIAADYEEAIRCRQVGANKAATAMSRRAVQAVCIDLGADPKSRLFAQIDQLHSNGEFTNRLHALAHKVRSFGNVGAHPESDGLDAVVEADADQSIRFLEHLLQHVYILGDEEEGAQDGD